MDYNTTAVNSISNINTTAYLPNSRKSASFSSIVELNISLSTHVLIHCITVGKETGVLYAMPIHIPSKRCNEDLPKSVEVEFVDRFRGLLDVPLRS